MKKFAALMLALMLVLSMTLVGITSVSAATGLDLTKLGTLTLSKGDSSADDPKTTLVPDATFTAYKVFDLVDDGNSDATLKETEAFAQTLLDSEINLSATGSDLSNGAFLNSTEELENIIPALVTTASELEKSESDKVVKAVSVETKNGTEGTGVYVFDNLALGIYLVVETEVPAGYYATTTPFLVSIPQWDQESNAWNYSITARPKDAPITISKKVMDKNNDGEYKDSAVYAIGQTVPFQVKSSVPDYGDSEPGVKLTSLVKVDDRNQLNYVFTDKFSDGLTFNQDSVEIIVDGVKLVNTEEVTLYTLDEYDEHHFKITIDWYKALDAKQGKEIILNYSAVLNENAVTDAGNTNEIKLKFANDLQKFNRKEIGDKAEVYTFEMHLNKTFDGVAVTDSLRDKVTDVTFTLSTKTEDTYVPVPVKATETAGVYNVWEAEDSTKVETYDINLDSNGKFIVKGLKAGTYYLEETATIKDYGKLPSRIKIVVNEKTNGSAINVEAKNFMVGDDENGTLLNNVEGNDNAFIITVNNTKKQFNLPDTGGLGIWMFTVAGGIVMACAIIMFIVVRKKKTSK